MNGVRRLVVPPQPASQAWLSCDDVNSNTMYSTLQGGVADQRQDLAHLIREALRGG